MKLFSQKLRVLFLPFAGILVIFPLVYSALNWLLFIKLDAFSVRDDIVNIFAPFVLVWVPLLMWLRPRFKFIVFRKENASFLVLFLAAIAILIPTVIAQVYLETATGKLTKLGNISRITQVPKTKYYSADHYYVETGKAAFYSAATVTGKYNNDLNYAIFVVMPIIDSRADTLNSAESPHEGACWLGMRYAKTISNRLSDAEKDAAYQKFAEASRHEFDVTDFQQFTYLERVGNTEDHSYFDKAIKESAIIRYEEPILLVARKEPFEKRNGNKPSYLFLSLFLGAAAWLLLLSFLKLKGARA